MGVELHVAGAGHALPPEDGLDARPEVAPDLVEVIVLLDGLASVGLGRRHVDLYHRLLNKKTREGHIMQQYL